MTSEEIGVLVASWAVGGVVGLLALFFVIRAAMVSALRRNAVWAARGGLEGAIERAEREDRLMGRAPRADS